METVWIAFASTALVVAAAGLIAFRFRRRSRAFSVIAWSLLVMAGGTAVFPALLPVLGVKAWAFSYIAFVVAVTGYLTVYTAGYGSHNNEQHPQA